MRSATGPEDREHVYALPNGSMLHEYKVQSILGHGGFGITYLALDTLLNESVAIKEYLPSYLAVRFSDKTVGPKTETDGEAFKKGVEAFLNEARTIARFRHPNITQVRRYFELNGTGYIVLNREEGVSLDKIVAKGRLPEAQLREIFFGALAGLEVVHAGGVLHRDVKPNNIIVRPDGSAVLIDFGAARDFQARKSMTTIMSPGYAPPEQYGEGGVQGFCTDFYGLGATAYQCITGKKPDDSLYRLHQTSHAKKDPLIPAEQAGVGNYEPSFLRIIDWMLRLNENERPQTVAEIRKHFETPGRENRKLNPPPRPRTPARTWNVPWKPILGVLLAAVVLIGGGLYIGTHFFEPQKQTQLIDPPKNESPKFEPPKIDPLKPTHPASVNELSHLTNTLHAAGYDRTRLDNFQKECGLQCPADLDAEFKRRMSLLDKEKQQVDSARDNADELEAYVQTCDVCEFKDSAEQRLSDTYAKNLASAGFDRAKLNQFLRACQTHCSVEQAQTAHARLDVIAAEDTQYKNALANSGLLKTYLNSCMACMHRDEAEQRIADLEAKASAEKVGSSQAEEPAQIARREDSPITDPTLLDEIKTRLFEQNLDPGSPGSHEMTDAIHTFQTKAGVALTDQPTSGLLQSLRNAEPLGPWGAIVYAKEAEKWGMAWSASSRREALADAHTRCGSDKCVAELSFYGHRCGAFALSPRSWAITWRTDETLTRRAALDSCEKGGAPCRIIGAVCADGSGRVP